MINLLDKTYAIPSNGSTWALCKTFCGNFKGISQMWTPISFIHIHPARFKECNEKCYILLELNDLEICFNYQECRTI